MASDAQDDPRWVDAILDWRWTWLAARVALTGVYIIAGLVKVSNFAAAAAEQDHFGLHPGWLWAMMAIVVEIGGPLLIISGRFVWLGAGALGVLTAIADLVANNFWTMSGPARFPAMYGFLEHIGLIAAFVMAALIAEHSGREQRARGLLSTND